MHGLLEVVLGGGVLFGRMQTNIEAELVELEQQRLELAVGLDGGDGTREGAVADGIVGHPVGIVVEHALGHGDAIIHEASRGFLRFRDLLASKEHCSVGAKVGPVGMLGKDDARFVTQWDGHHPWQFMEVATYGKRKEMAPFHPFADMTAGTVLKDILQGVIQGIMDHGMVTPIVKVEIGCPVFGIQLGR